MRVRAFLISIFALLLATPASATQLTVEEYGSQYYSPGDIQPSHYDNCQYFAKRFIRNDFAKSNSYLGKALFINLGGGWIAAAEDTSATTVIERYDLISTVKKGAVKNTGTVFTYYGIGAVKWDNSTGTISCA
jgi:hypothetical protein